MGKAEEGEGFLPIIILWVLPGTLRVDGDWTGRLAVSGMCCLIYINRKGILFADLGAQITMKSFVTHFSAAG